MVHLFQVHHLLNEDRVAGAWTLINTYLADNPGCADGLELQTHVRTRLEQAIDANRSHPDYAEPSFI